MLKIVICGFVIGIFYLLLIETKYEHMEGGCEPPATNDEILDKMGKTAKDACNKISTEAENIAARMGGKQKTLETLGNIFNPVGALINPKNWKSGDNTVESDMRNIINNNLSSCDHTKIENSCKIRVSSNQINSVNTSDCPFCQKNGCPVRGVRQTNNVVLQNNCTISSIVDTLTQKKGNVEAQALAELLQEAQGTLSGDNSYKSDNCNVINNDMSSTTYLDQRASCVVENEINQQNIVSACGSVADVIQKNHFEALGECKSSIGNTTKTDVSGDVKTITDTKSEQKTKGSSLLWLWISLAVIGVICIGVGIWYFNKKSQMASGLLRSEPIVDAMNVYIPPVATFNSMPTMTTAEIEYINDRFQ